MIKDQEHDLSVITLLIPQVFQVDIWSLGVLMLELFLQEPPYIKEGGLKCMFVTATQGLAHKIPTDEVSDEGFLYSFSLNL